MLGNRSPRSAAISLSVFISASILFLSILGTLAPAESLARVPLTALQGVFGSISTTVDATVAELIEIRTLRERNQELEQSLAAFQSEVAESREIRSDYERLAALVNYTTQTQDDWRYIAADVIGRDPNPNIRTIHLNRGTRDGIELGDPVVTDQGLVGRVTQLSATGAEVLLVTDQNSAVEVRLQSTRDGGLVQGTLSGDLILTFVDADSTIQPNDLVLTSGATQRFPADLIVGQVTNPTLSQNRLFRESPMVSFVDFERLEIVLVITNWEPVDVTVFEEEQ